jgi:hypothetical protein
MSLETVLRRVIPHIRPLMTADQIKAYVFTKNVLNWDQIEDLTNLFF